MEEELTKEQQDAIFGEELAKEIAVNDIITDKELKKEFDIEMLNENLYL